MTIGDWYRRIATVDDNRYRHKTHGTITTTCLASHPMVPSESHQPCTNNLLNTTLSS